MRQAEDLKLEKRIIWRNWLQAGKLQEIKLKKSEANQNYKVALDQLKLQLNWEDDLEVSRTQTDLKLDNQEDWSSHPGVQFIRVWLFKPAHQVQVEKAKAASRYLNWFIPWYQSRPQCCSLPRFSDWLGNSLCFSVHIEPKIKSFQLQQDPDIAGIKKAIKIGFEVTYQPITNSIDPARASHPLLWRWGEAPCWAIDPTSTAFLSRGRNRFSPICSAIGKTLEILPSIPAKQIRTRTHYFEINYLDRLMKTKILSFRFTLCF